MLNQARASLPGLTIYAPDFFTLLDNMVTHPANYGFSNATSDAIDDGYTVLNGPGTNYLFWDYQDPTAKAHEVMADTAQQMISPGEHQQSHLARWQQPVGRGQRSDWPERLRGRQDESCALGTGPP